MSGGWKGDPHGSGASAGNKGWGGDPRSSSTTTAAPAKKGGGGFFGSLKSGAHWIASKTELAGHDIKQIPGGTFQLGKLEYNALKYDIQHPHLGKHESFHDFLHGSNNPASKQLGQAEVGMAKGAATSLRHPGRDPFQTLLTVGMLGRGAAGLTARGSAVAREGSLAAGLKPYEPAPRLLKVGDQQVPLHASKNPLVRGAQGVHDRVVQKAIDTKPEGRVASYGTKRVGGSQDETARYQQRMREVPAHLLQAAAKRLAPSGGKLPGSKANRFQRVEQAALELTSVNTGAREAAAYHLGQARKGVSPELNRAVGKLYQAVDKRGLLRKNESGDVVVNHVDHPKLAQADVALAKVQGKGDEILSRYGVRTAEELKAAANAPGRYRAGATYEKPTPAKAGVVSQATVKAQARVARLEKLHERAKATKVEADAQYRGQHTSPDAKSGVPMHDLAGGHVYPEDVYSENQARYYGHGDAPLDKATFAIINRVKNKPTAPVTIYRGVPGDVNKINPGDWVTPNRRYAKDHAAGEDGWHVISQKVPADQLFTNGDSIHEWGWHPGKAYVKQPRAERLGGALSVAKDELQRLEASAAKRVKPTGIVGGTAARPGRGHVSYASREKKAPTSVAAASAGPVVGEAKAPVTSHANTGYNIEHGKVPNNVTGQAARHFHQIVRFVNTTKRRNEAIKTGAKTRQTERDVLVKIPGAEHAKIPAAVEEILGKTKLTTDDVEGLHAALNAYREDMVPGLRDRFAADRQKPVGHPAPEGHVWVDRNVLGDLGKPGTGPRGKFARTVDNVNSAVTAATVYFKIGHIGTRYLTNAATNIIQGSATPLGIKSSFNIWHGLSHEDKLRALAAAGQHGFEAMPHEGTSRVSKVAGAGANWWAKHADAPFRFNSLAYEARKAGFDTPAKFKGMLDRLERPNDFHMNAAEHAKIDWVAKRANRAQIAYDRLGEAERRYITRAVWFYPWIKGATMFGGHTITEHPYKAAVIGAAGAQGRKRQQQELGDVPSYEQGLFQLAGGARPLVSDFSTFSPFATPADLLDTVARPGEAAGFLNPVAGATNSLINGVNAQGAKTTSPLTAALAQLASTTPESQILTAYLNRNKDQSRRMFRTTPMSALARSLVGPGLPRRVNPDALHSAAARQRSGR